MWLHHSAVEYVLLVMQDRPCCFHYAAALKQVQYNLKQLKVMVFNK
jgi:hypothetical protein